MTKDWTQVGKERFNLHPSKLNLTKEFNLSKKRISNILSYEGGSSADLYYEEDVKEFIRLLKERLIVAKNTIEPLLKKDYPCFEWNILEDLNALVGDKLK